MTCGCLSIAEKDTAVAFPASSGMGSALLVLLPGIEGLFACSSGLLLCNTVTQQLLSKSCWGQESPTYLGYSNEWNRPSLWSNGSCRLLGTLSSAAITNSYRLGSLSIYHLFLPVLEPGSVRLSLVRTVFLVHVCSHLIAVCS